MLSSRRSPFSPSAVTVMLSPDRFHVVPRNQVCRTVGDVRRCGRVRGIFLWRPVPVPARIRGRTGGSPPCGWVCAGFGIVEVRSAHPAVQAASRGRRTGTQPGGGWARSSYGHRSGTARVRGRSCRTAAVRRRCAR
jgi:hypothetical protein